MQVDAGTSDELADVGVAFNDMARSLQVKAALLEEQQAENERLLLSMMPENLVRKYKEGATTIAFDHQEVSVIFADIVGFEGYSRGLDSEAALAQLNEILLAFDEAAERYGIERVRTTRSGYLASCGLSIPRVDNARRIGRVRGRAAAHPGAVRWPARRSAHPAGGHRRRHRDERPGRAEPHRVRPAGATR